MAVSAASQTPERTPISFRAWLGIVLLFLFFGIFVLVLVAATPHGDNYEAKRAQARKEKVKTTRDAATKELSSYAWVDKAKGVARIPIDRAMQLTMRDLASKKPAAANPIETAALTPEPAPVASPAPPVHRNRHQSRARLLKIVASPLPPPIHRAQYQGHSRVLARHPPPRRRRA